MLETVLDIVGACQGCPKKVGVSVDGISGDTHPDIMNIAVQVCR